MLETMERSKVVERYRVNAQRFADLVRSAPDANAGIPHLAWTIGDTAAHLISWSYVLPRMAQGEPSPVRDLDRLSEGNAMLIAEVEERDPQILANLVEESLGHLAAAVEALPPDRPFTWHANIELSGSAVLAIEIGECLVHGWDVARALGRGWPIERQDAILTLHGVTGIMPYYVDEEVAAGFRGAYEIRLRGNGSLYLRFDDGDLDVCLYTPGTPVDCRMSVDPTSFLLIGYGRMSPLVPSLTGKVLAWGRKPWLGAKFPRLLRNP